MRNLLFCSLYVVSITSAGVVTCIMQTNKNKWWVYFPIHQARGSWWFVVRTGMNELIDWLMSELDTRGLRAAESSYEHSQSKYIYEKHIISLTLFICILHG